MMTVRTCLDNKKRKNGLQKVMFRFTKNRRMMQAVTYISVLATQWNKTHKGIEGGGVKNNHPMAPEYNKYLLANFYKIQNWIKDNPTSEPIDAKMFFLNKETKAQKEAKKLHNVKTIADKFIAEIAIIPTRKRLRTITNKFLEFFGDDLILEDITREALQKYVVHLQTINKATTINKDVAVLISFLKKSVKDMPADWQPWSDFTYLPQKKSLKTYLSEKEFQQIQDFPTEPGSVMENVKNAFLMQFYIAGERVSDVLCLSWDNITDARFQKVDNLELENLRCTFKMYKSRVDKMHSILLPAEAIEILKYYKKTRADKKYVFPFFDILDFDIFGKKTEEQAIKLDNTKSAKNSLINNYLKKMCVELGISPISTHTARRTFAEFAKKYNGNLLHIKDALGHSKMATTEGYLNDNNFDNADIVQNSVHAGLKKTKEST